MASFAATVPGTTAGDCETWTSTARAIIRCDRKGCRRAHRAGFTTSTTLRAYEGRPSYSRTVTHNGRTVAYRDRHDLARIICDAFTCTGCGGHGAAFNLIQGSYSAAVKCGPKCRNAVGASCDCQCGGENHGAGHSAI